MSVLKIIMPSPHITVLPPLFSGSKRSALADAGPPAKRARSVSPPPARPGSASDDDACIFSAGEGWELSDFSDGETAARYEAALDQLAFARCRERQLEQSLRAQRARADEAESRVEASERRAASAERRVRAAFRETNSADRRAVWFGERLFLAQQLAARDERVDAEDAPLPPTPPPEVEPAPELVPAVAPPRFELQWDDPAPPAAYPLPWDVDMGDTINFLTAVPPLPEAAPSGGANRAPAARVDLTTAACSITFHTEPEPGIVRKCEGCISRKKSCNCVDVKGGRVMGLGCESHCQVSGIPCVWAHSDGDCPRQVLEITPTRPWPRYVGAVREAPPPMASGRPSAPLPSLPGGGREVPLRVIPADAFNDRRLIRLRDARREVEADLGVEESDDESEADDLPPPAPLGPCADFMSFGPPASLAADQPVH